MFIHFIKREYDSYADGLNEPYQYFWRIISDRFKKENIEVYCNKIEIQLAVFSEKPKGKDKEIYETWYNKLPIYYRGKNLIRIVLPLLNKEEGLEDIFEIIYQTFEILNNKKKKDDILDFKKIMQILYALESELKNTNLFELNKQYDSVIREEELANRIEERTERENRKAKKRTLIHDLKFYHHFKNIDKLYFAPYDNTICKKILSKLRKKKFKLPDYTHLYIKVSDSFENALHHSVSSKKCYAYGIAVLKDYVSYIRKNEQQKKKIVFNLICDGLNDIAGIEKLDVLTLKNVLEEVEKEI